MALLVAQIANLRYAFGHPMWSALIRRCAHQSSSPAICSASFPGFVLILNASNPQEEVSVIVPRAQNDPSVCDDTQRRNIEVRRRGKVQDLEFPKEMILFLRPAGSSIE